MVSLFYLQVTQIEGDIVSLKHMKKMTKGYVWPLDTELEYSSECISNINKLPVPTTQGTTTRIYFKF